MLLTNVRTSASAISALRSEAMDFQANAIGSTPFLATTSYPERALGYRLDQPFVRPFLPKDRIVEVLKQQDDDKVGGIAHPHADQAQVLHKKVGHRHLDEPDA